MVDEVEESAEKKKKKESKKNEIEDEEEEESAGEEEYDIKSMIVDFRFIAIGEKMKNFREGKKVKYIFNDYTLSKLITGMEANTSIFNQTSVMRIIDYQWTETRIAMEIKFYAFLCLYYFPFLVVMKLNGESPTLEGVIMSVSLITNLFFFYIECVQMMQSGIVEYFKEGFWNFVSFTQFLGFLTLFIIRFYEGFLPVEGVAVLNLRVYLSTCGFMQILFFIRIYEDYGFLV